MAPASGQNNEADASHGKDFVQPPKRQVVISMACVTLVMFLGAQGQTIVATALPDIVADLGGFDRYVWIATAYMVAATITAPIAGGLSDVYGRKPFFILGLAIFVAASALLGISRSMNEVVTFRAVQGIGGGLIMTSGFVAVADLFPPQERGKHQGLLAGVYGIASVVGPIVGDLITAHYSWNWIFLINIPIAVPALLLMVWIFPSLSSESESRKLDYPGMVALVFAVVPLLLALSVGGVHHEWDSALSVGMLALGLAMAVVFIVIESRAELPIMPMELYADRSVSLGMIIVVLTGFGLYSSLLFLPLFFRGVLGMVSSSLLVPMLLGIVFGGIVAGQLLSRTGGHYRFQVLASTALTTIGMYLISTMNEATYPVLIGIYLVLTGLGLGGTLAVISVAVQNSVPFRLVGAGTSANQFFRTVGGMLGLTVVGVVMTLSFGSKLETMASDDLKTSLPEGLLESVKQDPQALLDPSEADLLRERLVEEGPEGIQNVDSLLDSLNAALVGALSDVFTVLVVTAALSSAAALLFRVPTDVERARQT